MQKSVFTSDELPRELDDRARFSLWRDIYEERYGAIEMSRLTDRPFSAHFEFVVLGAVMLGQFRGTMNRGRRTSEHVAADARGDFIVGINSGSSIMLSQRGRDVVATSGTAVLFTNAEISEMSVEGDSAWATVLVPRSELLALVANADDLSATPLDMTRPAIRHLSRYIDFVLGSGEIADGAELVEPIGDTLLNLVALSLGASGDVAEAAAMRGLRAARIHDILTEIRARFADQGFSPHDVARKLDLSPRYVQDLLQETGSTFTERVMELRLQKARAMLATHRHDRLKISDIAYAVGFSNVSYFNQAFRRRFGASPTQYRAGKDDT